MPNVNLHLNKDIKNTENRHYMSNYKIHLCYYLNLSKWQQTIYKKRKSCALPTKILHTRIPRTCDRVRLHYRGELRFQMEVRFIINWPREGEISFILDFPHFLGWAMWSEGALYVPEDSRGGVSDTTWESLEQPLLALKGTLIERMCQPLESRKGKKCILP